MTRLTHDIGWALAIVAWGSYLVVAFAYTRIQTYRMLRRFNRRPGSLLDRTPARGLEVLNIEDAATFHVTKFTPEDWCLCRIDIRNRRLLLEGVSHRYVIRGCDVTCLRPPARGSGVNVEIHFRIGDEELRLVATRPNMPRTIVYGLSRYPLLGWPLRPLVERSSPRFARQLATALGIPLTPSPATSLTPAPALTPAPDEDLQRSLDTSC